MTPARAIPARALLVAALTLGGCRLIDQRTFSNTPAGPAAADVAHPDLPKLPLLTITLIDPDTDWRPALDDAVRLAQSRKPEVAFDVITPIPTTASRDVQDEFTRNGQADAQMISDALQQDGIPPARITLGFHGDPGAPPRSVMLYAH